MAAKKKATHASRRIYFFRIDLGRDATKTPLKLDAPLIFKEIDKLPFTEQGRYLHVGGDVYHCVWVQRGAWPARIQFGALRRSDFPLLETKGKLDPLPIPPGSSVSELVHMVFFPEHNILGADFNFYGPRVQRLSDYLFERSKSIGATKRIPRLDPLLRQNVYQELKKLSNLKLVHLKVKPSFVDELAAADESLAAMIRSLEESSNADDIEVKFSVPRRSKLKELAPNWLSAIRDLSRRKTLRDSAGKIEVAGFSEVTQRVEAIDVLADKLIYTKEVVKLGSKSKALDPESVFKAIEQAYIEHKTDLVKAAAVFSTPVDA